MSDIRASNTECVMMLVYLYTLAFRRHHSCQGFTFRIIQISQKLGCERTLLTQLFQLKTSWRRTYYLRTLAHQCTILFSWIRLKLSMPETTEQLFSTLLCLWRCLQPLSWMNITRSILT